ncbi:DUF6923 family protein, partial [Demequina sediminicola]|uniref:DUF7927 domain-containing protein n=1 Tax=Demequina sediminicola TaxID=1095026 RepID=UPI0013791F77
MSGALVFAVAPVAAVAVAAVQAAPAVGAPGTPGVMQAPTVAWYEDFQNIATENSTAFVNTLVPVTGDEVAQPGYFSPGGDTYTSDPDFTDGAYCNGLLVRGNGNATLSSNNLTRQGGDLTLDCDSNANWTVAVFASNIAGRWQLDNNYPYNGQPPELAGNNEATNYALSLFNTNGAAEGVLFDTAQNIPTIAGHSYMATIDVATATCQANNPVSLVPQIELTQDSGSTLLFPALGEPGAPNSCAYDYGIQAGNSNFNRMTRASTQVAPVEILSDGSPLQYTLSVQTPPNLRSLVDNPVIVDTTPQLDKEFLPGVHVAGQQSRVTFTVTNTHMVGDSATASGPKTGWSFDDTLPPGLEVSSTPDPLTTCTNGSITGTGTSISGTGDLSGDSLESCTLSINVVATAPGEYTNVATDVSVTGLTSPDDADILYSEGDVCPTTATLWQFGAGNITHANEISLVTGDYVDQGPLPGDFTTNAVGYNEADGYYYGVADSTISSTPRIYAISPDYSEVIDLGEPDWSDSPYSGGNFPNAFNVGDVTPGGIYYARGADNNGNWRWAAIDVNADSPDFMKVVGSGGANFSNANYNIGADWSYNPADGKLYSVGWNTNSNSSAYLDASLFSLDPGAGNATQVVQSLGRLIASDGSATQRNPASPGVNANYNTFGATYMDADGFLYASANGSGHIWRINVTDPSDYDFFAFGPSSSGNDGARCASAPVSVDFGDAPESYGTFLADGGPFHEIVTNDLDQPLVMLGGSVSRENEAQPSALADADNDDAFTGEPVIVHGDSGSTVQVPVTNNGGEAATLVGWVDFDQSGTFDEDERGVANAGTSTGTVTLSFPNAPDVAYGPTFMRLRVSYEGEENMPTDTAAGGSGVSTGEVEDWRTQVIPSPVECQPGPVLINGDPVDAYRLNLVTGESELLAEDIVTLDAAGYNTNTGYVYGLSAGTDTGPTLVLATGEGDHLTLGEVTNSTATPVPLDGWTLGDFDNDDHLVVATGATDPLTWAKINVTTGQPDFLAVDSAGTAAWPANVESLALDWAYDPVLDSMVTVGYTTGGTWVLLTFDLNSETFEVTSLLGLLTAPDGTSITGGNPDPTIGGVMIDENGFAYITSNDTGQIWRIEVASGATDFYSYGPAPEAIDEVGCPLTSIPVDFGDAPNSYGTTLSVDGARHSLIEPDGAEIPDVFLGSPGAPGAADSEFDGQPDMGARGDDNTADADETGLPQGTTFEMGSAVSLTVDVTNNSDDVATVAGWVDLNGNGVFAADELATGTVPANAGESTTILTFDAATTFDASTYVRLRVVPGTWADPQPTGPAAGGEVEDHRIIAVPPFPFECSADGYMTVGAGPVALNALQMVTGEQTEIAADVFPDEVNALGYHPLDDYIYGTTVNSDGDTEVVRVGADGTVQSLGVPVESGTAVALTGEWTAGDIDESGQLWLARGSSDPVEWAQVDLDGASSTFLEVLTSGTADLTDAESIGDWAVAGGSGGAPLLYSVGASDGTTDEWSVVEFDAAAGTFSLVADLGALTAPDGTETTGGEFPAIFADPDGYIYAHHEGTGLLWRVASGDGSADFFAYGGATGALDGARCATAPLPIDFGDLPDQYGTELNADGARHGIVDYDSNAGYAPLMLGFEGGLDTETDGVPSAGADGDDIAGPAADDEDGVQGTVVLETGEIIVVPVAVTNDTDEPATLAAWIDFNADGDFADAGEVRLLPVNANFRGIIDVTFPAQVEVFDTYGRVRLMPGEVADAQPTGAVMGGEVEDYAVVTAAPELDIEKSIVGDPNTVAPGETMTYEVTLTNPGSVNYTDGNPARFVDNMTDVLDDAAWAGNVAVTPSIPADTGSWTFSAVTSRLTWQGPLQAGESVSIRYDVTINTPPSDDGDPATDEDILTNVVTGPAESNCALGADPADPLCSTTVPVEGLLVTKEVTPEGIVTVGDEVFFTITVENVGAVTYDPATVTDNLAEMVDDATYQDNAEATINGAPATEPDVTGDVLTWSGTLAQGDVAVITFSFIVDEPDDASNGDMSNVAQVPGSNCVADPDTGEYPEECTTDTLVGALEVSKAVTPADEVYAGDEVTYTVTVENTGAVTLTVPDYPYFDDDLSDVLAEGELVGSPSTALVAGSGNPGVATVNGDTLHWETDTLDPGGIVEVEYTIKVDDTLDPTQDHILENSVVSIPGSSCEAGSDNPDCTTSVPIRALELSKTADPSDEVAAGSTVKYTVVVTNTGAVDYDGTTELASFEDNLTGVLDDATWDDNITITPTDGTDPGTATFTAGPPDLLSWAGPLLVGESTVVEYTVTVGDPPGGDSNLANVVAGPAGSNCAQDSSDANCGTETPVRAVTITKSSPNDVVLAGDLVTYEVVITNTGNVAYTEEEPLLVEDTVTAVLDDAVWTGILVTTPLTAPQATFNQPILTWEGPLGIDETVTIRYSLRVTDPHNGDGLATNTVAGPPESNCDAAQDPADPNCTVTVPVQSMAITKIADPTDQVEVGGQVIYTITVENTGQVAYGVDDVPLAAIEDDLSSVLDDADFDTAFGVETESSLPRDPADAVFDGDSTLTWEDTLAVGETVTIRYAVTVTEPGVDSDGQLDNAVVGPPEANCSEGDDPLSSECTTNVPVLALDISKEANVDVAMPGDIVQYTVTIDNTGGTAYPDVVVTDDLTDVLTNATWVGLVDPVPAGTEYVAPELTWSGDLAADETITIVYEVQLNDTIDEGAALENVVVGPPGSTCPTGLEPGCTVTTPVSQLDIVKTVDADVATPGEDLTYTVVITNTGSA